MDTTTRTYSLFYSFCCFFTHFVFAPRRQSPLVNRRLSTLVEEASDAEADESIAHSHTSATKPYNQSRGPVSRAPVVVASQPISAPSSTGFEESTAAEVAMRKAATEAAKTPPLYKAPPAYREALHSKSRDNSPQPGQRYVY